MLFTDIGLDLLACDWTFQVNYIRSLCGKIPVYSIGVIKQLLSVLIATICNEAIIVNLY